ncbi:hypothetical protein ACOMHN_011944 [Nucella lapillus]
MDPRLSADWCVPHPMNGSLALSCLRLVCAPSHEWIPGSELSQTGVCPIPLMDPRLSADWCVPHPMNGSLALSCLRLVCAPSHEWIPGSELSQTGVCPIP